MTDQLQLRDWQQMCQAKSAHYAGTPEADSYLAESKRYGMAADRIEELTRIIAGLRAELAQAKPKRASTLPAPRHGPCNYPYWRIIEKPTETDAEFVARHMATPSVLISAGGEE